jgi:hypothetical protein
MTTEQINLPIYIKLIEKKGPPTDKLVETLRNMSQEFSVNKLIQLISIEDNPTNPQENVLIYSVTPDSSNKEQAQQILSFLKRVWEKLFDNYPAYTEPI